MSWRYFIFIGIVEINFENNKKARSDKYSLVEIKTNKKRFCPIYLCLNCGNLCGN